MPIIFAQSVIVVPGAFAQFIGNARFRDFADLICRRARRSYYMLLAVLILFFTYFYTSIIFNPVDLAENLKKQGGFIPGVKPGAQDGRVHRRRRLEDHAAGRALPHGRRAAADLDRPRRSNVPFRFGGTSLLIVVGVALDTIQQMKQHLLLRKYDGFMKKGRVRFRGRQGAPRGF